MGCLKLAYHENPSPLKVVQGGVGKSAKVAQRFLSTDPLTTSYPWYTPYQFAGNKPIIAIDLDGAEEAIRINYHSQSGTKTQVILLKSNDIKYAASQIWGDLKDGIKNDNDKFTPKNAFFAEGFDKYSKGSLTKGGHNISPLRGELTIDVQNGRNKFSYNEKVTRDKAFVKAESQYGFGQAYDIAGGMSNIGSSLNKAGLASLFVPVIGEAVGGGLIGAGEIVSGAGDAVEIIADFRNGDRNSSGGKFAFFGLGKAIDIGLNLSGVNKTAGKAVGSLFGVTLDAAKSGAYQDQQKPSAGKIDTDNQETINKLK